MTGHSPSPSDQLLDQDTLVRWTDTYFKNKEMYLSLLKTHGSPLWIIDSEVLKAKAQRFSQAFNAYFNRTSFYFAMKSNNHHEISGTLIQSGFGLDVSSGIELETALALKAKDIIFSGPGKTDEELALALRHRDRVVILLDSLGELSRLGALASGSDIKDPVRVGIRLTTNPTGLWRKFGICLETLPKFWEMIKDMSHIHFKGIQFHSSWNMTPDRQIEFIETLGKTLAQMPKEFTGRIEFIDIGGGYWPEEGEWLHCPDDATAYEKGPDPADPESLVLPHYQIPGTSIDIFAKQIHSAFTTHVFPFADCRICFEPGRWICHSAMHLFMSVVDKKDPDLVITDAGTNIIGWERFETDYFPVLNLTRSAGLEKPCHILGSLCTPHDVFGYAYFGESIEVGDCLMIPCQGAYTYSLRQNFIKGLPKVVKI